MKVYANENFVSIRIKKGYSQAELAKRAKVSCSSIHSLEKGQSIRPITAKRICDSLNEGFDKIFTIKEERK